MKVLSHQHSPEVIIDSLQQVYAQRAQEIPDQMEYYSKVANALTEAHDAVYNEISNDEEF